MTVTCTLVSEPRTKSDQQTSDFEALMMVIRGNLGPGCMSLPYAFTRTGWLLGSSLMVLVSVQGIYCMWLCGHCKQILSDRGVRTLMDLASAVMGTCGKQMVRFFLITIQGGICCCFIRLISTNVTAALHGIGFDISNVTSTILTTSALLPMAVLRFLAQLKYATLLGNVCLFTAVISVVVFSATRIALFGQPKDAVAVNPDPHAVFDCVSTLFYAFEGVGVILPIENSMRHPGHFGRVLVSAMTTLAVVFILVGALSSIAFPHTGTGSITAFLVTETGAPYFQFVNGAVTFGVFLTFPLQLFPAVEAILEVLEPHHVLGSRRLLGDDDDAAGIQVQARRRDVWRRIVDRENVVRVSTVFVCAFIALAVEDLGLLVALVGAVGSTGLVMAPCAVHLQMQRLGLVQRNWCQSGALILILCFCSVVLVLGTASASIDILRSEA